VRETRRRSLVKAISWRVVALIITAVVGYALSRSVTFAISLSVIDSAIKIAAYYLHERAWISIPYGRVPPPEYQI